MPTLKDVAKKAGVSPMTVSRVIGGREAEKVSEATRARVLRVAKKMGYQPNIPARALRNQRTYQFALVVPNTHHSFIPDIIQGLQNVATTHSYSCLLALPAFQPDLEYEIFRDLVSKRVDGFIWFPGPIHAPELDEVLRDLPVVQLLHKQIPDLSAVLVDQTEGAYMATKHLLELGHRRIGSLMVPDRHGEQRQAGFEAALKEAGLSPYGTWSLPDSTWEDAHAVAHELMDSLRGATAILCYSDLVAWGVMRDLQERGLHVPEDISLIGFDNLFFTEYVDPPLTTVAQPKADVGERAMQMLLAQIDGEKPQDELLVPTLALRSSTAAPRREGDR